MKELLFKIISVILFSGMLVMNFLANSLPLNKRSTGQISSDYPSYFTPSGFTFSIWGVIYILLTAFVIQMLITQTDILFNQYSVLFFILFFISCVVNITWLLAWHFDKILLSTIIMIIFLVVLIWIAFYLTELPLLTRIAFSTYAGWVSIALIANVTVLLVKSNLPIFQNNQVLWYLIIMVVGVVIGLTTLFITRNVIYILVYVWAYFGIFMKHFKHVGYFLRGQYNWFNSGLILLLIIGIGITLFLNGFQLFYTK